MRYLTILLALFIAAGTVAAFTVEQKSTDAAAESAASFKLVNDTDADVQIHTGSGFIEINKSSSTSITCEAGREIRLANKGRKGDVLFVVTDSMCGKTVKLSAYL